LRGIDTAGLVGQAVVAAALFVARTTCSKAFLLNAGGRIGVAVKTNLAVVAATTWYAK
jgi:hypothetical protein